MDRKQLKKLRKHRVQPGEATRWVLQFGDIVYLKESYPDGHPFWFTPYDVYNQQGELEAMCVMLDGDV